MLTSKQRKSLRQIAHHLEPVVTISDKGLSDTVLEELQRALRDHELIKVKLVADREGRAALAVQLSERTESEVVQSIGKVLVVYKENPRPNPKLSNLARFS
ncbi:MAG: ribosome assembly RNA-binding protein YhbY [Pseudomonadota bacterium]